MDIIFLRELKLDAMVGIYRRERVTRQAIELDLDIALPTPAVFASGKVSDTIDYAVVVGRIREELAERRFGLVENLLVENLAEFVATLVLDEFHAPWVRVSVAKLGIIKGVKLVGVTIERTSGAGKA
ncbi:MAG: dihydroneopterin aldolase [Burkholderiales bacterium]|nr:dihydroneopterin aldolase [Burkholderiales bacterium]